MGIQSERTLLKLPKNGLHLVLTQCADIDSRADRPSKPCLLLSCYQAVGGLRLAGPALSFAKPPSDKDQDKQNASRLQRRSCRTHRSRVSEPSIPDRDYPYRIFCDQLTQVGVLSEIFGTFLAI